MIPGARIAAAITIIGYIKAGISASRFAGSKDRVAIRDHVLDV
ncbi:hypothetical protein [Cognatiyoonia sp. IB215446]